MRWYLSLFQVSVDSTWSAQIGRSAVDAFKRANDGLDTREEALTDFIILQ